MGVHSDTKKERGPKVTGGIFGAASRPSAARTPNAKADILGQGAKV
jgi:hypothetical protein